MPRLSLNMKDMDADYLSCQMCLWTASRTSSGQFHGMHLLNVISPLV